MRSINRHRFGDDPGKHIRRVVVASILVVALICLGGCKDSRAIKNIEHDQNAETIDYESGITLKKPSEEGKLIGDDTNLYKLASKKELSKRFKVNTKYASKDMETTLPVARFAYDANSKNDSEATEGVKEQQQKQQEEKEQEQNQTQDENKSNQDKSSGKSSGKNSNGDDSGKSKGGSNSKDNGNKGTGDSDADATVYDTTGESPEIPDVESIAATGQTAVIVQMLGGSDGATPLKAADSDLLKGKFSNTFSDEGSSSIEVAWKDDGTENKDVMIDTLIKSDPDTVLATSQEYFTKSQQSKLAKAGISITVVPSLRSDTRIEVAVKTIGQMLDKATNGTSSSRASDYIKFHDELISSIEGSQGYGAYQKNKQYYFDADASSRAPMYTASKFTLVIDQWDKNASFGYQNVLSSKTGGVGICTVGYRTSPISYYLGVAGVVNNAAAIETNEYFDGQLAPAWQFNTGLLKPSDVQLSSSIKGELYTGYPNGFTKTTLTKVDSSKNESQKNGFGSDTFPVVIVADKDMKTQFKKSAASSTGLYHAFGLVTSKAGTFQGLVSGSVDILTTIDTDVNLDKQIKVNPKGWFSDWTEGSAESFLESAWAANVDLFENDWSGKAADEVKDFYSTFYRCDISDKEAKEILNPEED